MNSLGTGEVTISGTLSSGGIPLSAGWNLVGLKGSATKTVSELVAGQSQLISLWKWEGQPLVRFPARQGGQGRGLCHGKGVLLAASDRAGRRVLGQ